MCWWSLEVRRRGATSCLLAGLSPPASNSYAVRRWLRWRATWALLLFVPVLPAQAAAVRCDITQLETLTPRFSPPPKQLVAGRRVAVIIDVVRAAGTAAERGAEGIEVLVALTGKDWGGYDLLATNAQGRAVAHVLVPRQARGRAELELDVFRTVVGLPCLTVEEHGRAVTAWSKAP